VRSLQLIYLKIAELGNNDSFQVRYGTVFDSRNTQLYVLGSKPDTDHLHVVL